MRAVTAARAGTPAAGFTCAMLVDDVLAFVDSLGIETQAFHLMGFSMGAMTALHVASRQSDRVRTLVVIGITTQREPRTSVVRRPWTPTGSSATTRAGPRISPVSTKRGEAPGGVSCPPSRETSQTSRC